MDIDPISEALSAINRFLPQPCAQKTSDLVRKNVDYSSTHIAGGVTIPHGGYSDIISMRDDAKSVLLAHLYVGKQSGTVNT